MTIHAEAHRDSNRRASGPQSQPGKDASRANALKEGLAGSGPVVKLAHAEKIARQIQVFRRRYQPATPHEEWLVETAATEAVLVEECQLQHMALQHRAARRAQDCWETDRIHQTEELAAQLPRQPGLISAQLEMTAQGCDFVSARWRLLRGTLREKGCWTDEQRSLALDLLGVPVILRTPGITEADVPAGSDAREVLGAVVQRELDRLTASEPYQGLEELDEYDRDLVIEGLRPLDSREARLVKRYEGMHRRAMSWALQELERCRKERPRQVQGLASSLTPQTASTASDEAASAAARARIEKEIESKISALDDLDGVTVLPVRAVPEPATSAPPPVAPRPAASNPIPTQPVVSSVARGPEPVKPQTPHASASAAKHNLHAGPLPPR